jgi:hypothetical protein
MLLQPVRREEVVAFEVQRPRRQGWPRTSICGGSIRSKCYLTGATRAVRVCFACCTGGSQNAGACRFPA